MEYVLDVRVGKILQNWVDQIKRKFYIYSGDTIQILGKTFVGALSNAKKLYSLTYRFTRNSPLM